MYTEVDKGRQRKTAKVEKTAYTYTEINKGRQR